MTRQALQCWRPAVIRERGASDQESAGQIPTNSPNAWLWLLSPSVVPRRPGWAKMDIRKGPLGWKFLEGNEDFFPLFFFSRSRMVATWRAVSRCVDWMNEWRATYYLKAGTIVNHFFCIPSSSWVSASPRSSKILVAKESIYTNPWRPHCMFFSGSCLLSSPGSISFSLTPFFCHPSSRQSCLFKVQITGDHKQEFIYTDPAFSRAGAWKPHHLLSSDGNAVMRLRNLGQQW